MAPIKFIRFILMSAFSLNSVGIAGPQTNVVVIAGLATGSFAAPETTGSFGYFD